MTPGTRRGATRERLVHITPAVGTKVGNAHVAINFSVPSAPTSNLEKATPRNRSKGLVSAEGPVRTGPWASVPNGYPGQPRRSVKAVAQPKSQESGRHQFSEMPIARTPAETESRSPRVPCCDGCAQARAIRSWQRLKSARPPGANWDRKLVSVLSKDGSGPPPAGERRIAENRYRIPLADR